MTRFMPKYARTCRSCSDVLSMLAAANTITADDATVLAHDTSESVSVYKQASA